MELNFLGATHEVTGSCTLATVSGKKFLVDCGMEQGKDIFENQPIPAKLSEIDYVFLTHAHIDHSGNLPILYKNGFRGKIFMTEASAKLGEIMLKDSAHIQKFEAEWRNRKAKRSGEVPYTPLYTMEDALGTISLFVPCNYGEDVFVDEFVTARFYDAGHMLGSSSIKITMREDGVEKSVLFSGDIGNVDKPLLKDPQYCDNADYLVIESTYGNRLHGDRPDYTKALSEIIIDTFSRGGNVVIPSFAVGRTQELLYILREIKQEKLAGSFSNFDVYVDSPLANEATKVFKECLETTCDEETAALLEMGINPVEFEGLHSSISTEDSKAINFDQRSKIIISASGMCEAGRIRHHLKHNLWRSDSTILFVGYQTQGTIGRQILDGARFIKLFGEEIEVKAKIENLAGISGHADVNGLIKYASALKNIPQKTFVVHGDDKVCEEFAQTLSNKLGHSTLAPFSGTIWDIGQNICENQGIAKLIVKTKIKKVNNYSPAYAKLVDAGEKITSLISTSKGFSNRELERIANELKRVIDRW